MKSGFVSIIGRPNVGKSTLLNTIMQRKIAIISNKAQTTRNNIMGIYHDEESQIIFIDTPGIHKPKHNLGKALNNKAYYTINDVDVIVLVVDISEKMGTGDKFVIDKLKDINKPVLLVLNKIDKVSKEMIMKKIKIYNDLYDFKEIIPLSVISKKDTDILIKHLKKYLTDEIKYYDDDYITDKNTEFFISEYVREKILNYTNDEVPHAITCITENIKVGKDATEVDVLIIVERENLKKIIIGHQGEMIKKIGIDSRKDIENLKNLTKLEWFKLCIITINIIVFIVLTIMFANKYKITSYIILIYYLSLVYISLKLSKKNIADLNSDNKMSYIQTTILFIIFFSSRATSIYMINFYMFSHTIKEYLLIIYITIKLIFFIYCTIISCSIFISNLSIMLKKQLQSIKILLNKFLNKHFELKLYDFYFSNKKDTLSYLVLDIIIYILSCPFLMIIYFIFALCILFIKFIIRNILKLSTVVVNYFNNSSKIIRKTLKISTIISLIFSYIIITYNNHIFYNNTKDVFNLLTTVILIPLIYDSIKKYK